MKILVTGSSGMLGRALCGVLGPGHEISGLDIKRESTEKVKRFYNVSVTDADAVEKAISSDVPDVVIHAAAYTDVDGCEKHRRKAEEVNVYGAVNAALGAFAAKTRFIFISTDFVFDGRGKVPYREEDRPCPLSVYGTTKHLAEEEIKKISKRFLTLRTSWLFGAGGKNFVDTVISKASAGEELKVVDDQVGSPTYAKDLAFAIRVLIESGADDEGGILHVANSGCCSWREFAQEVIARKGLASTVERISTEELGRPARRPSYSVLDCARFEKLTGHRMRHWREALEEYIESKR